MKLTDWSGIIGLVLLTGIGSEHQSLLLLMFQGVLGLILLNISAINEQKQ